jgi:hypothetical protein
MFFYIIETQKYCKIGISKNIDERINALKNEGLIIQQQYLKLENYPVEMYNFLEAITIQYFQSNSEYLFHINFNDIVNFVNKKITNLSYHYFFLNPISMEICCINNTYYDFKPAIEYINHFYQKQNKSPIKVNDIIKTKRFVDFCNYVKEKENLEYSFFTKVGKYGTTYGTPKILFEFLLQSGNEIKYNLLNWSLQNKNEFCDFINCKTNLNINEIVKIALENN